MHISTNSDDVYDQQVKLKVRDVIIDELAPILDELAEEYDGLLTIGFVNVEECPKTVKAFRISSVPTLAFIVDGITEQRIIGLKSTEEIKKVIEKYVRRNKIGNTDAEQNA